MARILLVDDEPDTLTVASLLLSLAGHEVHGASSGAAALRLSASSTFDIVITDWMMPGIDGIELCRCLKADDRARDIPIILSSAAAIEPEGRGTLFDVFVRKPWSVPELESTMARLLNGTADPPDEPG